MVSFLFYDCGFPEGAPQSAEKPRRFSPPRLGAPCSALVRRLRQQGERQIGPFGLNKVDAKRQHARKLLCVRGVGGREEQAAAQRLFAQFRGQVRGRAAQAKQPGFLRRPDERHRVARRAGRSPMMCSAGFLRTAAAAAAGSSPPK